MQSVTGGQVWLDAEAAGQHPDLPATTISRMVNDGRLRALRFPVRIHLQHLDTVRERCRINPGELGHLHRSRRQPVGSEGG